MNRPACFRWAKSNNLSGDQKPVALIPAYKPNHALLATLGGLQEQDVFEAVYCVDDGSGGAYADIFEALEKISVHILHHHVNLGKGMALRTGFNVIACSFPKAPGIVTFDADGQHGAKDIANVARTFIKRKDSLVLGYRQMPTDAPLRSRFGNATTRGVLRLFTGMKLRDTQTGLRGIPMSFMSHILRLKTTGYDFELDMLITAQQQKLNIIEVPIETVYIDGNRGSHFNPIIDSMKIYFVFIRFSSVSLTTALIDYLVFALGLVSSGNLITSMLLGRSVAATFQFLVSYSFVFKDHGARSKALVKYCGALILLTSMAYLGIQACDRYLGLTPYISKILVEGAIFVFSFLLQRDFVFSKNEQDG